MVTSVGLGIDQNNDREYRSAAQLGEFARRLEAGVEGLNALWVVDNPFSTMRGLEPMVALTAMAATTTRLRLGTGILVASYRNPYDLARLALSLDQLSSGRLMLGIGAGSATARAAGGYPEGRWGDHYAEAIRVIMALTSGQKATSRSPTWRLDDAEPGVNPHAQAVDILLAAISPEALRRCARIASGWIGSSGSSTETFADQTKRLVEHLAEFGRPRESFTIVKRISVGVLPYAAGHGQSPAHHLPALGEPAQIIEEMLRLADNGVDHIVLDPVIQTSEHLAALAYEVIVPFSQQIRARVAA